MSWLVLAAEAPHAAAYVPAIDCMQCLRAGHVIAKFDVEMLGWCKGACARLLLDQSDPAVDMQRLRQFA